MFTTTKNRILTIALILTLGMLTTGCSDDSPTAPKVAEEPSQTLYVTVTATKIQCIQDGDGIEGKGDFTFESNIAYGGEEWDQTMGTGEVMNLGHKTHYTRKDYDGSDYRVGINFRATEWDQYIDGTVFADSDMNRLIRTAHENVTPGMNKNNYITLGNDNCKVRLHYNITSRVVEQR